MGQGVSPIVGSGPSASDATRPPSKGRPRLTICAPTHDRYAWLKQRHQRLGHAPTVSLTLTLTQALALTLTLTLMVTVVLTLTLALALARRSPTRRSACSPASPT